MSFRSYKENAALRRTQRYSPVYQLRSWLNTSESESKPGRMSIEALQQPCTAQGTPSMCTRTNGWAVSFIDFAIARKSSAPAEHACRCLRREIYVLIWSGLCIYAAPMLHQVLVNPCLELLSDTNLLSASLASAKQT